MARRIEVKVYEADGTTLVRTLTADRARQWLDELNLAGSWSLEVPVSHADELELTDGRIVRFFLDGTARFPGRIEPRKKVAADPSRRRSGRVVTVGGRGMLSILENGIVYPELGIGSISPEVRFFNFSSKDYDSSTWPDATELAIQSETDPALNPKATLPEGWPSGGSNAYWLWDAGGFTAPVDVGDVYLRYGSVTITNTTDVRFFITADDGWEFFFDGNRVASEIGPGLYGKTRYFDLRVVGGQDHTFAIKGTNIERPNPLFNIAGVIFWACELRGGGSTLGPPILRSNHDWRILAYPATPPGMTPGKILDVLLTEAQDRGTLTEITWDFDAAEDSDGVAWPAEIDVSFPVGKNYLEVVKVLVDEHALDVAFDAATMTLHAYVDRGAVVAAEAVLGPNAGANIAELGLSKTPPGPNTVLGRSAAGVWIERDAPAAVASWGRREIGLTLGSAPSDAAVIRQTDAFLDDHADPVEAIDDLRLEAVAGGPVPYATFGIGDRITAPDYELEPTAGNRVYSIGVGEDAAGQPIYTPELVK